MDELYEELSSAVMDLRSISPDHMALLLMTAITNGGNSESDGKNDGPEETETVYCWGSNSSQQLTDSVAEDKESFEYKHHNITLKYTGKIAGRGKHSCKTLFKTLN